MCCTNVKFSKIQYLFISFFAKKETNQRKKLTAWTRSVCDCAQTYTQSKRFFLSRHRRESEVAWKSVWAGVSLVCWDSDFLDFFVTFWVKPKSKMNWTLINRIIVFYCTTCCNYFFNIVYLIIKSNRIYVSTPLKMAIFGRRYPE